MTFPPALPQDHVFDDVVAELKAYRWRREVTITEIPSPQRIAPHSAAISAEVAVDGDEVGSGRLVLLHDPHGNDAWAGTYRLVSYARADVDLEMVTDPLLAEVGWGWLVEALEQRHATYVAASGTVTAVSSRCFGEMSGDPDRAEVEIRASWTPLFEDGVTLGAHLGAWQDLLCLTAGLPPLPEGVVLLTPRPGSNRGR
ncbi:DUF3000 domain-containing protein [Propionibacteriaceae bacterium Y1923]|uniref:DUF3000 domain-containing protein n=1 Tax=Aestuariimicrobium sp. Y1814 TaxID=3418742 RepID=UPI003C2558E7